MNGLIERLLNSACYQEAGEGTGAADGTPPPDTGTPPAEPDKSLVSGDEGKTPEQKAAAAAAAEPLTAESIKLPEGFETNDEVTGKFLGILNNAELDPKGRAQQLIDLQAEVMKAASERGHELWRETQDKWANEVKADPELGGDKLGPKLAGVTKLIDAYGSNELRDVLDLTGAGNNIHVVRFLSKIADQLVTEGGPVVGRPADVARDPASVLYPNQGKT